MSSWSFLSTCLSFATSSRGAQACARRDPLARRHPARWSAPSSGMTLVIASAPDASTLACGAGCSWCCYFTVDVRAVEVFRILDFVEQTFSPEEKARVYAEVRANSATLQKLDEDAAHHPQSQAPVPERRAAAPSTRRALSPAATITRRAPSAASSPTKSRTTSTSIRSSRPTCIRRAARTSKRSAPR